MAVDITLLFRASVKTVKTRNKALGVAVGGGVDGNRDELFRRSPRPRGDFSSRAREVVSWLLWERRAGEGAGPRVGPRPGGRPCPTSRGGSRPEGRADLAFEPAGGWEEEQAYFEEGGRVLGRREADFF